MLVLWELFVAERVGGQIGALTQEPIGRWHSRDFCFPSSHDLQLVGAIDDCVALYSTQDDGDGYCILLTERSDSGEPYRLQTFSTDTFLKMGKLSMKERDRLALSSRSLSGPLARQICSLWLSVLKNVRYGQGHAATGPAFPTQLLGLYDNRVGWIVGYADGAEVGSSVEKFANFGRDLRTFVEREATMSESTLIRNVAELRLQLERLRASGGQANEQ